MILKGIKRWLADRALKKQLQKDQPKIVAVAWESVKNIGLIFKADNQEMIKEAEDLVRLLENQGKNVQVLVYISNKKKITFKNRKNWLSCKRKDFSFIGVPKSSLVLNFIREPFDLLVDLNLSGQACLYYISLLSKATFKIGADLSINRHLSFSVDLSGSTESYTVFSFGQELINQLKKIQFA